MSAKNIVNPDHYKIAGRDRPNERLVPEVEKQRMAAEAAEADARRTRRRPAPPAAEAGAESGAKSVAGARKRRR
jgi:hypothetical protein